MIMIWTPQIIINICRYNRTQFPFFFFLTSNLERFYYGLYFRGYSNNFYKIKGNHYFVLFMLIYMFTIIIIIYLQLFFGPRFFMREKYRKKPFDYYKNKEELLKFSPDTVNLECVICLLPIFDVVELSDIKKEEERKKNVNEKDQDKQKSSFSRDFLPSSLSIEDNSSYNINNRNNASNVSSKEIMQANCKNKFNELQIINPNNNNKKKKDKKHSSKKDINGREERDCKKLFMFLSKEVYNAFFSNGFYQFYQLSNNIFKKKYMLTPCHHVFHTECLEAWFERKKECPNCRTNLSEKST